MKHLDIARPPWLAGSEFLLLSAEFDNWRYSLPQSLQWLPDAIYARRESSQLGALTLLWCTYYQTLVDLYRIGMPAIFRIRKNVEFPPDQQGFLKYCRRVCYENAREVSNVISEALRHGIKALADTWLCIIAHDSTKVMLYYMKHNEMAQGEVGDTKALIQRNLDGLIQMRPMVATAEYCVCFCTIGSLSAVARVLMKFTVPLDGQNDDCSWYTASHITRSGKQWEHFRAS